MQREQTKFPSFPPITPLETLKPEMCLTQLSVCLCHTITLCHWLNAPAWPRGVADREVGGTHVPFRSGAEISKGTAKVDESTGPSSLRPASDRVQGCCQGKWKNFLLMYIGKRAVLYTEHKCIEVRDGKDLLDHPVHLPASNAGLFPQEHFPVLCPDPCM